MQDYITHIDTALGKVSSKVLDAFINEAETKDYAFAPIVISGDRAFSQPANPADPYQYNSGIISAIADITSLYSSIDAVSSVVGSMHKINNFELNKIAAEVSRLETLLDRIRAIHGAYISYTNILHCGFREDAGDFSVLPRGYGRLDIDPITGSLVRPLAWDISRVRSSANEAMCRVSISNILGNSIEKRHPISEAIDGETDTYWREVILSDSPIYVHPESVNWLPASYRGGAAVELKFEFDQVTLLSELHLKPLSEYPVEVLSLAYSTNDSGTKEAGGSVDINGSFSDLTGWSDSGTAGVVVAVDNGASVDGTDCLKITFPAGDATDVSVSHPVTLTDEVLYELSFYAKSDFGVTTIAAELLDTESSAVLWREQAAVSKDGWKKHVFRLCVPAHRPGSDDPIKADNFDLNLRVFGIEGSVYIDNLQINQVGATSAVLAKQSGKSTVVIPIQGSYGRPIACKTLWLTIAQPNYTIRNYSIPKSLIDIDELYTTYINADDSPEAVSEYRSRWRDYDKRSRETDVDFTNASPLNSMAEKIGGKIKDMMLRLYRLATPSKDVVDITKYEYVLGAWEIDLRYKDYGSSGYWISKPIAVSGEIRQLTMVADMSDFDQNQVNVYVLPRAEGAINFEDSNAIVRINDSGTKKWSVYFKSSEESQSPSSDSDAHVLSVGKRHVSYKNLGTDRNGRLLLPSYPYVNLEYVSTLHNKLTAGSGNTYNHYDPNAVTPAYVSSGSSIKTTAGYTPVKVTLRFRDQVVPPDIVGKSRHTKYEKVSGEELTVLTENVQVVDELEVVADDGSKSTQHTTRTVRSYRLKAPVCWINGIGPKIALYWEKTDGTVSIVDPKYYTLRWDRKIAGVENPSFRPLDRSINYADTLEVMLTEDLGSDWTLKADYFTERSARPSADGSYTFDAGLTKDTAVTSLGLQSYPVTRNVTDYVSGKAPKLRKAVTDRTRSDYYPVYEYYIDINGNVVFANDFFTHGDDPPTIEVEYDTLAINPRILIEYTAPSVGTSTSRSPILSDYTVLLNART